jgi:hypothetical protein
MPTFTSNIPGASKDLNRKARLSAAKSYRPGKGSRDRTANKKAYDENYEAIFGKKDSKDSNDKTP